MIVVWFSCGAASAVAAKKTVEKYNNVRIVNNPVIEEHPDNTRFKNDIEKWLGIEIETAYNSNHPECSAKDVWDKRKYMAGISGAPCTNELKKKARQEWENNNKPNWHVLGFTADEEKRYKRFIQSERDNVIPVLIDENITKAQCFNILKQNNIELPKMYKLGYPNANCIGCVKASSPTYWNHVREQHPDTFEDRAKQSRQIGAKLVRYKGKRIYLDELPKDAKGNRMMNEDIECGIFCEEK